MRRALAIGAFAGVVAFALVLAVLARAGWAHVDLPRADGPEPWMLSRATGFVAFVALGLDAIVGLGISTRLGDRWLPRGTAVDLHRWLSPIALATAFAHGAILVAGTHVPFDALDVLVPFLAPYRPLAVGLGVIALYAAGVVHVSFALRARIGARAWRRLHHLSFVAFAAAAVHVVAAGTDAGRAWAIALIAPPVVAVAALVARRR
jgi:sulfoxide reductase heme-binding subunit YedZ